MPCTTVDLSALGQQLVKTALSRLEEGLAAGTTTVVVGRNGSIAFKGWVEADRNGISDLCAYRRLLSTNSPALRRAVARAEAMAGVKVNGSAVASGLHSHDGGKTWSTH